MRRALERYAETSSLMDITVNFGDEKFSFNLFNEVSVDENKINHEIQMQPSTYAFLNMLYKKLVRVAVDKEKQLLKRRAQLFVKIKSELDPLTNRPYNNDVAEEMVIKNKAYQKTQEEFLEAQDQVNTLEVCVKAFEQRYSLIQTLSANIRKNG